MIVVDGDGCWGNKIVGETRNTGADDDDDDAEEGTGGLLDIVCLWVLVCDVSLVVGMVVVSSLVALSVVV